MDNRDYKQNNDGLYDPWETDYYQTGSTRPPKNRRGLIALVLIGGIILGGVITCLGGVNSRIIRQWRETEAEDTLPMALHAAEPSETTVPMETAAPALTVSPGEAEVDLQPSPTSVATHTQAGGLSLQEIYDKCIDSTVSIICTMSSGNSTGSGVVLSDEGYIITNCHVVAGAQSVQVLLTDGRTLDARLIGADELSDLAVLYVEAENLTAAEFGDSDALRVGDTVVAIGDPLGVELRGTMTDGIVSAINRNISSGGRTMTLIQTNAALNSGNSGGPLINRFGQVIGINTMKVGDYVSSAGVEGLGFAIPSTTVKDIVDQLIHQGYVSGRPSLGISGTEIPRMYQIYYNLPAGVYVTEVEPGSDAETQGIQVQDVILAVDGQRVKEPDEIQTILYAHQAGDVVEVIFYRAGQQISVNLTLGESKS